MKKIDQCITEIQSFLGNRLSQVDEILESHSKDISWHSPKLPRAVCFPESTEEVAQIVKLCNQFKTPIIPYGAGTSVEGHTIPIADCLTVNLSRMNNTLAIHPTDQDCHVQAGVRKLDLNQILEKDQLFFAAGPGINATMGGIVATGASGANAYRYGTAKENVKGLTLVTPTGAIAKLGNRARKSSAGYNLTQLLVGSEGTLGIITEVVAKLHPIPEFAAVAVVAFPNFKAAIQTAIELTQKNLPLAMLELMDDVIMGAINAYSHTDYPVSPTLFLELHCSEVESAHLSSLIQHISGSYGGQDFRFATAPGERQKLWQARYDAAYAGQALRPDAQLWGTDVCVPISKLTECILETKKDLKNQPFIAPLFGHVGDGNFHVNLAFDSKDKTELIAAKAFNERLIRRALAYGGTSTGEHGIGLGKKTYLEQEFGHTTVNLMRTIKHALDPNGILNPGKVID